MLPTTQVCGLTRSASHHTSTKLHQLVVAFLIKLRTYSYPASIYIFYFYFCNSSFFGHLTAKWLLLQTMQALCTKNTFPSLPPPHVHLLILMSLSSVWSFCLLIRCTVCWWTEREGTKLEFPLSLLTVTTGFFTEATSQNVEDDNATHDPQSLKSWQALYHKIIC